MLGGTIKELAIEALEGLYKKCKPCGCSTCGKAYTIKDRCTGETVAIYVEDGVVKALPIADFKALPPCEGGGK